MSLNKTLDFLQSLQPTCTFPENYYNKMICFGNPVKRFVLNNKIFTTHTHKKLSVSLIYDVISDKEFIWRQYEEEPIPSVALQITQFLNNKEPLWGYIYSNMDININKFHPFIVNNNLNLPEDTRILDDLIVIPMKNFKNRITGLSLIKTNGDKILRGLTTHNFRVIGDINQSIFMTKNFKEALLLQQETGLGVVFTNDYNSIIEKFSGMIPTYKILMLYPLDNSRSNIVNKVSKELRDKNIFNTYPLVPYINTSDPAKNNFYELFYFDKTEFNQQIDFALAPKENQITVLGMENLSIYIYSSNIGLKKWSHKIKKEDLQVIADSAYWKEIVGEAKNGVVQWDKACEKIRQLAFKKDFNYYSYRKMGIYEDNDNILVNTGKKIIGSPSNNYVYLQNPIKEKYTLPAPNTSLDMEALNNLYLLLKKLSFQSEWGPAMLLSWIIYAPFFRCLPFRPHLSFEGLSSTGKSWMLNNIVHPMLEWLKVGKYFGNTTTIAGFLYEEQFRPRICLLEEKEDTLKTVMNEDIKSKWLELFRMASTETEGVSKSRDVTSGGLNIYPTHFLMVLCSINTMLRNNEDIYRFVQINLKAQREKFNPAILDAINNMDLKKLSQGLYSSLYKRFKSFNKLRLEYYQKYKLLKVPGHSANKWGIITAIAKMYLLNDQELERFKTHILEWEDNIKDDNIHHRVLDDILNYPYITYPEPKSINTSLHKIVNKKGVKPFFENHKILLAQGIKLTPQSLYISKNSQLCRKVMKNTEVGKNWFSVLRDNYAVSRDRRFYNSMKFLSVEIPLKKILQPDQYAKIQNDFQTDY